MLAALPSSAQFGAYRQHVDQKVLLRADAEFLSDLLHLVQKGLPEEVSIARRGAVKSRQHADQRRLSSAVVSQQRGDLALVARSSGRKARQYKQAEKSLTATTGCAFFVRAGKVFPM